MNNDMNILFLLRKVNCNDGIASYCQGLAEGLKTRGINVYMVSGPVYDSDNTKSREIDLRSSVTDWCVIDNLKTIPSFSLLKRIREYAKTNRISAINVHGLSMLMWGKILSIATGLPLIATYHPSAPGDTRDLKISNKDFTIVQKIYLSVFAPQRLIVLSQESKSYLERQSKALRNRISVVPGGIDTTYFRLPTENEKAESRKKLGLMNDELVCVLIGRLTWNKGHDLIIRAAQQIAKKWPQLKVKYLFVGHGEHEGDIRALAEKDPSAKELFRFFGYVDDIREALWASDLFLLPSRLEGFALVIPEAMSSGVVPIRTPSGGAIDQIIPGETGIVIPFEDVDALANSIHALSSESKRAYMAKKAADHAQTFFSRHSMVDGAYRIYTDLVAR